MADGSIDDPQLKERVDSMTAVPPSKPLLPPAATPAEEPKKKKNKGLGAFGILKNIKKKTVAAPQASTETPKAATAAPSMGTTASVGELQRKMKIEMLLKDLTRTVRLKSSRNILRAAFKDDKEGGFDTAWQEHILGPILKRNDYTIDKLGKAFDEFRQDKDVTTLRSSYEKAMARFRHLIMTE